MARNEDAGRLLQVLREAQFLTTRELPQAMRDKGIHERYVPCAKTLWRIEQGHVPIERYRFGLARFYDRPVSSIWAPPETAVRLVPLERVA